MRDVTGGSRLPLRIRPGAPTSSIDINASGNVGIGTASPAAHLDVQANVAGAAAGRIRNADATGFSGFEYQDQNSTTDMFLGVDNANAFIRFNTVNNFPLVFLMNSVEKVRITTAGNIGLGVAAPTNPIQHSSGALLTAGGVWTNASSRALKQDITDLPASDAMAALKELNPVTYSYKVDPAEHHVGFIAEDVPNLVATKDRKGVSPMDVVAVLTKVVQEQQTTIDDLKARLAKLEEQH